VFESVAAPLTLSVLDVVIDPMTLSVLDRNTLPTTVVVFVFASIVVASELPEIVRTLKTALALTAVLPVIVTTPLALMAVDLTLVVLVLMFRKLALISVLPLFAVIETLFVVTVKDDVPEFATMETTFAPEKTNAVFVSSVSVLPAVSEPPAMPVSATSVLAPK
jgi:hypothetical protein